MKSKRSFLVAALLSAVAFGRPAVAQEPPAPSPQPEAPTAPAAPGTPPPTEPKEKAPFALYVEAGYGIVDGKNLDTSLTTLSTHVTSTTLGWEEQDYARAAVGWKLAEGKGDFHLVFNGYSEKGYTLESTGFASQVQVQSGSQPQFNDPLPWWTLSIEDGTLSSTRTPMTWTPGVDTNGNGTIDESEPANSDTNRNGFVDLGEQTTLAPDVQITRPITDNLENRAQNWDLLYGKSWGPRRFRGRWWAGVRYFEYEGNVFATAWLTTTKAGGYGFTDGSLFHVLNFSQSTTGGGPTGSLEAQFKFFRERLSLFAMGQAAFVVLSLKTDSGPFYTTVEDDAGADLVVPGELHESLSKSTWQTGFETGVRYRFDSGLELELAYNITGYLDAVIAPTSIRIPGTFSEARFGTSAIYRTQDYVLDGWRVGMSFQF